ncbi:MAG: cellulase family glycosylhydrolase [Acidimicrobiia bacterium]
MRARNRFVMRSRLLIGTGLAVVAIAASACDTTSLISDRKDHDNFQTDQPTIDNVVLMDVATNNGVEGFDPISDGATIDLDATGLGDISFRADTSGPVRSVRFVLDDGAIDHTDSTTPWTMLGTNRGQYNGWTPEPGEHTLTVTPFDRKRARGAAGGEVTIRFTITGTPKAPAAAPDPAPAPDPQPAPEPTAAPAPQPTAAPAPPAAATGAFTVSGTRIIAPDGKEFIPVGANFMGPHGFWPSDTIGQSSNVQNVWRWNTIRLNMCKPGGCNDAGGWDWSNNNDIDKLVNEYTSKKIVVMLADHSYAPGTFPTGSALDEIRGRWTDLAARFKDNPYVWFNPLNEPGNTLGGNSGGVMNQWLSTHQDLITAIRSTGNNNIVVVDGTNWGQEAATWDASMIDGGQSAAISKGQALKSFDKNVVMSLHVYGSWGAAGSQAERDARLANYIDHVHQLGLALLIGEVGGYADNDGTGGGNELADWLARATTTAYRVAPGKGVGLIAWHAQPGDGFALTVPGNFADLGNTTNPTTLTWHGQLMWKRTHGG